MKRYYLFLVLLLFLGSKKVFSQYKRVPFVVQDSLLVDLNTLFPSSEEVPQDESVVAFESVFNTLNTEQQERVFNTLKGLYAKRIALKPHFVRFFESIDFAKNARGMDNGSLSRFLEITDTTATHYKRDVVANFLKQTHTFLKSDTVYTSKFNSVVMTSGSFSFEHTPYPELMQGELYASTEELPEDEGILLGEEEDKEEWFDESLTEDEEVETEEDDGWGDGDDWSSAEDSWSDGGWGEEESDSWEEDSVFTEDDDEMGALTESAIYTIPDPVLPEVKGPHITLKEADFMLLSSYDTLELKGLEGDLMLANDTMVATQGKITWKNVGYPEEEVYADLGKFSFDFHNAAFQAERASLTYNSVSDQPIEGLLEYKSHIYNKKPSKAQYPRFKSYMANIVIEDFLEDVTYQGGVTLEGKKFRSQSVFQGGKSMIRYDSEGGNKFTARSQKGFVFADSLLYSPQTAFVIHYSEDDSISHPAVELKYHTNDKLLQARKDKDAYKISKFVDTRNDVNISAEYLEWSVEADSFDMQILNARERIPLVVESKDYFNQYRFIALKGSYNFHPLQMVVGYSNRIKSNTFYYTDMATTLKQNPEVVKGAMMELGKRGYIDFDASTGVINIKRKAKLYVYAMQGRKGVDFDNMIMHSRTADKANLTVALSGKDFKLEGVDKFMISDSMQVMVTPQDGKVNLKDGRNTTFGGEMRAGNFIFRGPEFVYNYDSFNINLDIIDSIGILVTRDDGVKKELANNIVQTGGTLYISDPKNKSGKRSMGKYPILDATKGGAIYFDRPEILGGAYDHRIHFEIPAFLIDSLNDNNTDVITFDGTFKTEGIFPDFEETISIQPDYSFGFTREIEPNGTELYNGKATYYNKISLNNKGIRGDGKIDYLSGSFESKDFVFYSDSVNTKGIGGEIVAGDHEGVSYPSVKMKQYDMRWMVNSDSMLLTNLMEEPFEIYDTTTQFEGTLALTNKGLNGDGKVETPRSVNVSDNFKMEASKYVANNSSFTIKSGDPNTPGLSGDNVKVEYDLGQRAAVITSEVEGDNSFTLPFIEYETNISQVIWNLDQNTLVMSVDSDNEMGLGKFTSNNKRQDSLEVFASDAVYDLNEHILNLEGVPYITIANVRILPDSGKVLVRENADIDELTNATVEMNAFNKYHTLTDANISIISRNKFEGEATYQYTMGVKEPYEIRFDKFNIKPNKAEGKEEKESEFITTAEAFIEEDADFNFLPGFVYKGKLTMFDSEKYLKFEGEVALDVDREENDWFAYNSSDEETHGVINVDENLKVAGYPTKLATGLFIGRIEREFYPSLVKFDRDKVNDFKIFQGSGRLVFDEETKDYILAPQEKLDYPETKGNQFIYNFEKGEVSFEGDLNLVENTKEYEVITAGKGKGNFNEESYEINTSIYFKTVAVPSSASDLGTDIYDNVEELIPPFEEIDQAQEQLALIFNEKQLDDYLSKYRNGNESLADFFGDGIMLNKVNLKWSSEFRSFYTNVDIGLGNVFKTDVNSLVTGYLEIPKNEGDGEAKLFIMANEENWFYFSYSRGGVKALSSNAGFNANLAARKGGPGLARALDDEFLGFISSYRMNYLGLEEILDLYIPEDGAIDIADDQMIDADIFGDVIDDQPLEEDEEEADDDDDDDDDGF